MYVVYNTKQRKRKVTYFSFWLGDLSFLDMDISSCSGVECLHPAKNATRAINMKTEKGVIIFIIKRE